MAGARHRARLYAENPANQFLPTIGGESFVSETRRERGLRVDNGIQSGDTVSIHFDPMLAKLIARPGSSHRYPQVGPADRRDIPVRVGAQFILFA
ncbi:MAG: hypothetical protein IPL78_29210 [Chloroflexi bacterium]|nr:hypothetical protein [Chloroflexota bacterium]